MAKPAKSLPAALSSKPRLSNSVYERIREAIQQGDFVPGDRILEEDIANRFKISRTPVREALRRLEDEGLLIHQAHQGLTVAKLDYQMVMELFIVRDVLEGAAARMAAQFASAPEVEMLVDMTVRERELADSAEKMALHNRRFHAAICTMAHNRYLSKTLGVLSDSMALLSKTSFSLPDRRVKVLEEHLAIVEAIKVRDPERAEAAARAHIHSAHRTRLKMLSEAQDD
jgi:DNA-binding GntR family transcriptional regulator